MEYLVKVEGDITEKATAEIHPSIVSQNTHTLLLPASQPNLAEPS